MTRIAMYAADPAFRVAAAELPVSVVLTDDACRAQIVVGDGGSEGTVAVRRLRGSADAGAPGVLHRPRLRPDVVADVAALRGWFPRLEVDVTAPPAELWAALADAAGWVRALTGHDVTPGSAATLGSRVLAESRAGASIVTWQVRTQVAAVVGMSLLAVGPRRVRVQIGGAGSRLRVTAADEGGERLLPTHWEAAERVTLRRAVDVVRGGVEPLDQDEARRDGAVADWLTQV